MSFKEVKNLRKAGNLKEAYELALKDFESSPDDIWSKRALAWVYYDYLKVNNNVDKCDEFLKCLEKLNDLNLPEEELMVFDKTAYQIGSLLFALTKQTPVDYRLFDKLFEIVKNYYFTKPSDAYSFLYKAFHQAYKEWNNYLEFANWWDFNNFQEKDYKPEIYEGRKMISLAENAYIAYSKKLLEGEAYEQNGMHLKYNINKEKVKDFLPHLDALISEHPEYIYPQYYKAKFLILLEDNENSLLSFLPFAKLKKNDFWVWDLMADVFPETEKKVACYCKALSLKTPEDFLVRIRQKFAKLLIEKELFAEAKTEIEKLFEVRNKNGWKIPEVVKTWMSQDWYKSSDAKHNNKDLYINHINEAEEILFNDIPEEIVAVEFVNSNKHMLQFVKDKSKTGFFKYQGYIQNPKIGDVLKVRMEAAGNDGFHKVLSAKKVEDNTDIPALKTFEGILKKQEHQAFGFVDDIFVDPDTISKKKLAHGDKVKGKAILSFNKKKKDWGWKVVEVYLLNKKAKQ